jgi:hypothetical protein
MNPMAATKRRGATIIIVIALFAVTVTMTGVWIRTVLASRRQMALWHEQTRAAWLADAGLRRAAARLSSGQADSQGERWHLGPELLGGSHDGEVAIRVEPADLAPGVNPQDNPRALRIIATADCPAGDARHVRITKTTLFPLESTGEEP